MKIRIIREYHSLALYRDVAVGEELEAPEERAEKLIGSGFAVAVAEKAEPEAEQKPARKRTARGKANTAE